MNPVMRFIVLGLQDADRRVGAVLSPRPLDAIDRYADASQIVKAIDRATETLTQWWRWSRVQTVAMAVVARLRTDSGPNYRALGSLLLIAVIVNVTLTLIQGPRPGWFWMLIPGMTAAFAVLVLAGSRSASKP